MSLTQDHGNIVFECDGKGCHETLETGTSNFDAARNFLRRARWKPIRSGHGPDGNWLHHCPSCQRESELPLAHGKKKSEHAGSSV